MARFRPVAPGSLRREALMPLRSTSSLSFLAIIATCVILLAAAVDAFFWNQGAERRDLQRQVRESALEAELLRFENERLRRRLLEVELAPRVEAERILSEEDAIREIRRKRAEMRSKGHDIRPKRRRCDLADPLCGL